MRELNPESWRAFLAKIGHPRAPDLGVIRAELRQARVALAFAKGRYGQEKSPESFRRVLGAMDRLVYATRRAEYALGRRPRLTRIGLQFVRI